MAVSQINQANGIQGRPLGVIVCDNDSDGSSDNDADETTELVDYLAGQLGVAAIIGPSSSANATVATAAITNGGYDTAIISPSATGVQLTNVFDRLDPEDPFGLFWRTCPSDAFQGKRLASLIASLDMVTNVAIIFQQDQYGTGLRDSFRTEYEKDAAKTVSAHGFSVDNAASLEANIAQAVDDAEQANPHALLVISGDATRTLFVLSRVSVSPTLDLLPVFLTDGSKDAEALLSSGDADINEILSMRTQGTAAANPQSGNFVDDFNAFAPQKRDKDYRATDFSFVAHAYDAAYIAAYGAAYASRSGKAITGRMVAEGMSMLSSGGSINVGETEFPEAVNALRQEGVSVDIEGASGPLDFDASVGEAPGPIEVWSVNNTFDGFNVDDNPQIP